jgi:hydrogenase maturation protease
VEPRVLIAGIGNIFLGDDGFGVEVIKRLQPEYLPEWARVMDVGVRGIHLAYELIERKYEMLVIVDAVARGGDPGVLHFFTPDLARLDGRMPPDPHGMVPEAVLQILKSVGELPKQIYVIGCEPGSTEEGIGLSEPVAEAAEIAVEYVYECAWFARCPEKDHA